MRRRSLDGSSHQPARLLRPQDDYSRDPASPIVWPGAGQSTSITPLAVPETGPPADYLAELAASPFPPAPDLQRQIDSARKQGQVEGEALGTQRANQRLEPLLSDLGVLLKELAQLRPRLRTELEEDTVKLALVIARRVLHRELATDPEAILGLVKAAFHKLNARETHRLRLAPQDVTVLEEFRARWNLPDALEIARDASLVRGSVVFETARGELDASVDTQLNEIERGLTDIMRRRTT